MLTKPPERPRGWLATLIRRAWPASLQPLAVRCLLLAGVLLSAQLASAQTQGLVYADSTNFTVDTASVTPSGQGVVQSASANFTVDTVGALPGGQGVGQADSANFALDTTGVQGTGGVVVTADSVNFTVDTLGAVVAFNLIHPLVLPGGRFQFSFTNLPSTGFSVFGATNISIPFSNWTFLGALTDSPPGQYQFTDLQLTNYLQRFYRVTSQ